MLTPPIPRFARVVLVPLLVSLLLLPACTEDLSGLNTPENRLVVDELDANNLGQAFAQTQFHGLFGSVGAFQGAQEVFGNLYSQIEAEQAEFFDSGQYVMVGGWINSTWSSFYTGVAPQLRFVREFTAENDMPVRNAVADVWRVFLYHRITDYWGPIIYSEFGIDQPSVPYDSQESIYKDFFTQLDEAVQVLEENPGGNAFGSNDQIYAGDVEQWLTFANSLRLRLALRIKYVEPELARQEAEKAVAAGVMQDNQDNATVLTTEDSRNPLMVYHDWNDHRMSAIMESLLEGYQDPRIDDYWSVVGEGRPTNYGDKDGDGSAFEGMRKGVSRSQKPDKIEELYSDRSRYYWRPELGGENPPLPVMRSAEVYFLRAEGALEGWQMGGSPEELYNEGIRMSLSEERIDASEEEIEAYIERESLPVAPGDKIEFICCERAYAPIWPDTPPITDIPPQFQTNADKETKLEQIITQKWLALYPDGWELWAEIRRTGYPKRYPIIESLSPFLQEDQLPQRIPFPESEYSNNTEAVEEAAALLDGPDQPGTEVWWDVKTKWGEVTYPPGEAPSGE